MRNKFMRLGASPLAVLASIVLVSAPITAQAQSQTLTQFDDATIARLLLDVQAKWQVEVGGNGRSLYRASADGGIVFTALPADCDDKKVCRSLMVLTPFTRTDDRDLAALDAFIARFNDQNPSAKVYRVNDGTVVLQGYLNAAGGISAGNAQTQLLLFGQNIVKLRDALTAFAIGS